MSPFWQAIKVKQTAQTDTHWVYEGTTDATWTVGSVPNGGYVLAVIIQACIHLQTSSNAPHKDPVHVTGHFLNPNAVAPFQILIRSLKSGKSFSHFSAEFIQNKRTATVAQLIFGDLTIQDTAELVPPSPYARRVPLHYHPSQVQGTSTRPAYNFVPQSAHFSIDPEIDARNSPTHPKRTTSDTVGGGGLEWGAWVELRDKEEKITPASLAFLADLSENMSSSLIRVQGKNFNGWCPTLIMTLEFKSPIPKDYNTRTVGIYSSGTFLDSPQGRHDMYTEVWTSPCNLSEGEEQEGWRDKQRCLAIATQMALTVSMAVNKRQKGKL